MNNKELYIVHCVDSEGPLYEDINATFQRVENLGVNLNDYERNENTISLLQKQEIPLSGRELEISKYLSTNRINYIDNWDKLYEMISNVTSKEVRTKFIDSYGNPYLFSWFIMDFIGFKNNPRRRPEGFHVMWDWYKEILNSQEFKDGFYWHFHTVPVSGNGTEYNSCWTNNDYHEQVLCKRLHDYGWFPTIYRSGGHIQSLDQSNWLEMFIPFDFSRSDYFSEERSTGDWRNAPKNWNGYHPNFYDNRRNGNMRRKIFRCTEIDNGRATIGEEEIFSAFEYANSEESCILAYSNHDRRDILPEIEYVYSLITKAAKKFPNVKWSFKNALDAVRLCDKLKLTKEPILKLKMSDDILWIDSNLDTFSTLPFISIKNTDGKFYRDNPMIEVENQSWVYKIRNLKNISSISVATTYFDGSYVARKVNFK